MTTIALLTDRQELLAFLALAGEGDIPPGVSEHDCIIMGVPEDADAAIDQSDQEVPTDAAPGGSTSTGGDGATGAGERDPR